MAYVFIFLTIACLTYALVKKRFIWLLAPIALMVVYVVVEIIMVPLPLGETLTFIFNLR